MIEIKGKYNTAKIFTDNLEDSARVQVQTICDQEYFAGSKIRMMPDIHAGKGCTVGTTMTITDRIVPYLVGSDGSCGMNVTKLKIRKPELPKLDAFIRAEIPYGHAVRNRPHRGHGRINLEEELLCYSKMDKRRLKESLGSLGSGNHYIEVNHYSNADITTDEYYLVIHTGSRNLGLQVADYYQNTAYKALGGKSQSDVPFELAYLTGKDLDNYLHDIQVLNKFANINRQIIRDCILEHMKWDSDGEFTTLHNYIDLDAMIIRKGAVSAKQGEQLIIPMNMRDGALLCTGLGNEDWNYSAPHGAGRICSRKEAENRFTVSDFKKTMDGIYTTSVGADTLDECPMAYKPMDEILKNITPTVKVDKIIKPVYNFKAGRESARRKQK